MNTEMLFCARVLYYSHGHPSTSNISTFCKLVKKTLKCSASVNNKG